MKLYDISQGYSFKEQLSEQPCIGEFDVETFEFGDVIYANGTYYACGVCSADKSELGVKRIEIDLAPEDKDYENQLVCPYCGHADMDSWELSDNDDEHVCGQCGAVMSFERHVEVTYCSQPVTPPNIIKAEAQENR